MFTIICLLIAVAFVGFGIWRTVSKETAPSQAAPAKNAPQSSKTIPVEAWQDVKNEEYGFTYSRPSGKQWRPLDGPGTGFGLENGQLWLSAVAYTDPSQPDMEHVIFEVYIAKSGSNQDLNFERATGPGKEDGVAVESEGAAEKDGVSGQFAVFKPSDRERDVIKRYFFRKGDVAYNLSINPSGANTLGEGDMAAIAQKIYKSFHFSE